MKYYPVEQSLPSDMSLGEIKLLVETREPILIFFEVNFYLSWTRVYKQINLQF